MANYVMNTTADVSTASEADLVRVLPDLVGLQVYTDGGFRNGRAAAGAAGVVFLGIPRQSTSPPRILGLSGTFLPEATSAFLSEAVTLDRATEFVAQLCRQGPGRHQMGERTPIWPARM